MHALTAGHHCLVATVPGGEVVITAIGVGVAARPTTTAEDPEDLLVAVADGAWRGRRDDHLEVGSCRSLLPTAPAHEQAATGRRPAEARRYPVRGAYGYPME